jgi:heparinase II/III-like protein/alginate lyase
LKTHRLFTLLIIFMLLGSCTHKNSNEIKKNNVKKIERNNTEVLRNNKVAEVIKPKGIVIPKGIQPHYFADAERIKNLRKAYNSQGSAAGILRKLVSTSRKVIANKIIIPPRGGQHNQWYQCDKCQFGLVKNPNNGGHLCKNCRKVYTGFPYDDTLFKKDHNRNFRKALNAAKAFILTEEKVFAIYVRKILMAYADKYLTYELHDSRTRTGAKRSRSSARIFEQTLDEASVLSSKLAPAYDLVRHSDVFSSEDRQHIETDLILEMMKTIAKNPTGHNNWQSWHNSAFIWGGALIGDKKWINRAVNDPKNGFLFQMDVSTTEDGQWYEGSWAYHFYTIAALSNTAMVAKQVNIDLWKDARLKKMFTSPGDYIMPDLKLPRLADDTGMSVKRRTGFSKAYNIYKDSRIAFWIPEIDWHGIANGRVAPIKTPLLPNESMIKKSAGHAILRSKNGSRITAVMSFGKYGGFHGHLDKLSFVLYANDKEYGVDSGRAKSQAYRLPIHRQWYKSTISHNAITIDGKSQVGTGAKLFEFIETDNVIIAGASCESAYKGVAMKRWLAVTANYLLVVDDLKSDKTHTYEFWYHNIGNKAESLESANAGFPNKSSSEKGLKYLRNTKNGKTKGQIIINFKGNKQSLKLLMARKGKTSILTANGPMGTVQNRVPVVRLSRRAKDMVFATALVPGENKVSTYVKSISQSITKDGIRVVVTRQDGKDTFIFGKNTGLK